MPINDKAFASLKEAIAKQTENDDDKLYLDYYPDAVTHEDNTIGREPANLNERKLEIFSSNSSFENILKDQFIKFGIDNVYGKAQSKAQFYIDRPESSKLRPDSSFRKDDSSNDDAG